MPTQQNVIGSKRVATLLACLMLSGIPGLAAGEAAATAPVGGDQTAGAGKTTDDGSEDKAPDWQASTLSGDWDGTRQRLFDAGVQVDLVYTADYVRNNSGGIKRGGGYMGNLNLAIELDGEKLIGWRGGSAHVVLISSSGGRVNLDDVGSYMGVDNIEVPVNRSGIFEAWLQQSFLDGQASLRAGLYPLDSEFYVTDSSGVFLHPSFGPAAEFGSFGSLAGPSIYATSSYGARLRVDPDPTWYAMLAISRGIPSERIDTAGRNISWRKSTGSLLIGEVGFSPVQAGLFGDALGPAGDDDDYSPISKVAVGAWRYAPRFEQLTAVDANDEPRDARHWGAYLLGEQTVYRVPGSKRDLSLFARYGFTDGRTSTLGYSLSAGMSFRGPFPGREDDVFGIAATRAHADPQGRALLADESGSPLTSNNETVVEITYQAPLLPGLVVQPVIQRIFNPGFQLPDSTVVGVRLQLTL
ncbi:MAG: Outer membrane protein D1 [Candidatus Accumulibacter adjunctus]|uniref:Outer membrane protein D1 n=1 Tax=Candidatus Accumulibacter adjunctus TaxID=1454001 RepID=A0A011MXH4_9PROT|nr:MAG: Outer membrane protein D1 [Candidatus Accumulibacter adjunctus]